MTSTDELRKIAEAATPGPWSSCPDDGCKCNMVLSKDYPVCEVTKGDWGDNFPSIRLVGDSSLLLKAEGFMDQITYGSIAEEQFVANRKYIREFNPAVILELISVIEKLREATDALLMVCGRSYDANANFEELAEAYHRETRRLAPGKDRPAAMGADDLSHADARIHFNAWIQTKIDIGRRAQAALTSAGEKT